MTKFISTISLLFILLEMNAQKMQMIKGYCGIYYKTMEDLYRQKQAELDFYGFQPRQVIASIGPGMATGKPFRKIYAFRKRSSAG